MISGEEVDEEKIIDMSQQEYAEYASQHAFERLMNGEEIDSLRDIPDHDLLLEKLQKVGIDNVYLYGDENGMVMRLTKDPSFWDKNISPLSLEETKIIIGETLAEHNGIGTVTIENKGNTVSWHNSQSPEYSNVVDRALELSDIHIELIKEGLSDPSDALLQIKADYESELGREVNSDELLEYVKGAEQRADIHMDMLTENGLSLKEQELSNVHIEVYDSLSPTQQDSFMQNYIKDNREVIQFAETSSEEIWQPYKDKLDNIDPGSKEAQSILEEYQEEREKHEQAIQIKERIEEIAPHHMLNNTETSPPQATNDAGGLNGNAVTYTVSNSANDALPVVDHETSSITLNGSSVVARFNDDLANPDTGKILYVDATIDQTAKPLDISQDVANNSNFSLT